MFVRTERLLIRPGFIEDAPALAAGIGDLAVARNLSSVPWPYSRDDAVAFLTGEVRTGELASLIFMRSGDAPLLVGGIGLNPVGNDRHDWGIGPAMELGYWIARPYWGLGIATEAGRAVIETARSTRMAPVVAAHFVDNPASGRVLAKLGLQPTGRIVPRYCASRCTDVPALLFALPGDDEGDGDAASLADMVYRDSEPHARCSQRARLAA